MASGAQGIASDQSVLRQASSWEAAEALIAELAAEELEYPFAEIVSLHRSKG